MPFDYNLTASEYSIYPQSRNDVDVRLAAKRTSQAEMVNYTQTRQEAWLKEVVETGISRSFEGAMAQPPSSPDPFATKFKPSRPKHELRPTLPKSFGMNFANYVTLAHHAGFESGHCPQMARAMRATS